MSGYPDAINTQLLSCKINGAQFIIQPLGTLPDTIVRVGDSTEERNATKIVHQIVDQIGNEEEEEAIPLICLDGQVYAVRNGQLQALDISQLEYENGLTNAQDSDVSPSQDDHSEQYEIVPSDSQQLLVVAKDNINADDFVEVVTAFKCKICPYTTQDRDQLLAHVENIHANPKVQQEETENTEVKLLYMCGECSNCFSSLEDCREHMIKDHQLMDRGGDSTNGNSMDGIRKLSQSTFKPSILGSRRLRSPETDEKVEVLKQQSKKSEDSMDRIVKCTYRGCPYKFITKEQMQQHAICHLELPNANIFKCNLCRDVKFPKWRPCSLHLWKKHQIDVDLLSCKICKAYRTATMDKLLTHMKVHSDVREYKCPDCDKCFKQSCQLRNHKVVHLDRKTIVGPRWYTSKTCDLCGKTYADSKCLKNHIQAVHSRLRPYVCNVCGHSSARKAMLQMHLRQHTGDKPFSCELCNYKTGDHNSLRRHMMRHTGVRPYKCPHCPYSAIQSNSYKNHLRSKHPLLSGLFTCELCSFKTVKKESYLQHAADHQKGLIKATTPKKDDENVEVFPGNIAAAQLIYSCLGAFNEGGKTIEANLMSSSTSADGTSQTITIQIPSKHLEGSLPTSESTTKINNSSIIEQEDDETMHCFLKIPREEEENIDTGGITIPAEPEEENSTPIVVDS